MFEIVSTANNFLFSFNLTLAVTYQKVIIDIRINSFCCNIMTYLLGVADLKVMFYIGSHFFSLMYDFSTISLAIHRFLLDDCFLMCSSCYSIDNAINSVGFR